MTKSYGWTQEDRTPELDAMGNDCGELIEIGKSHDEALKIVTKRYDHTSTRRQSKRREKLNEIARSAGWQSWVKYETNVLNGNVKIGECRTSSE